MQINPYLEFDGQCKAAFEFYARALNGQIQIMLSNGESPMAATTPPELHGLILHATLRVGDRIIQGADAPPGRYNKPQGFSVSYTVDRVDEAERVFAALSEGAQIRMPLQSTFWSPRFGVLVDRFHTPWLVNCDAPVDHS